MENEVILWPLTSSKLIVLVAQPISTDGGPPALAVDNRAEMGWPSSRGKGWPAVCKSGPRLFSFTVLVLHHDDELQIGLLEGMPDPLESAAEKAASRLGVDKAVGHSISL